MTPSEYLAAYDQMTREFNALSDEEQNGVAHFMVGYGRHLSTVLTPADYLRALRTAIEMVTSARPIYNP